MRILLQSALEDDYTRILESLGSEGDWHDLSVISSELEIEDGWSSDRYDAVVTPLRRGAAESAWILELRDRIGFDTPLIIGLDDIEGIEFRQIAKANINNMFDWRSLAGLNEVCEQVAERSRARDAEARRISALRSSEFFHR